MCLLCIDYALRCDILQARAGTPARPRVSTQADPAPLRVTAFLIAHFDPVSIHGTLKCKLLAVVLGHLQVLYQHYRF